MVGDYQSTLNIINQVLSCIPPFALHRHASDEAEVSYEEVFRDSDLTIIDKAKKAWMFPMNFSKGTTNPLPLAIRIEVYFSLAYIQLSPLTCAYYLQFLCYSDIHQYENRDSALEQLVDFAKHRTEEDPCPYADLNIAGHCLLLAGRIIEARDLFYLSYILTKNFSPAVHNDNSAQWYLLRCF